MVARRLDAVLAAAAAALFGLCAGWRLHAQPVWVGDGNDDAGYFLVARNLWRYGGLVIDSSGAPRPSTVLAPGLPLLLAPVSWLPTDPAIRAETLEVAILTAGLVVAAYAWMRIGLGLPPGWAFGAAALVATGEGAVGLGTGILSDGPGAALLVGGVALLRARRPWPGFALLVTAMMVRRLDLVVLGVAAGWWILRSLRLSERTGDASGYRLTRFLPALAGLLAAAIWSIAAPADSKTAPFLQADLEGSSAVTVSPLGLVGRAAAHAGTLLSEEFAQPVLSAVDSGTLRAHLLVAVLVLAIAFAVAAVAGLVGSGAWLELAIGGAVLAVALAWPFDPYRFLFPVAVMGTGGAAWLLRRTRVPGRAAAAVALLLLAGNLEQVAALTPAPAAERARVGHLRALYAWEAANVPRGDAVLTWADLQSFVYSGHPATRDRSRFTPGHTYVLGVPYGSVSHPGTDLDQQLVDAYDGPIVYADGPLRVRRAETAR